MEFTSNTPVIFPRSLLPTGSPVITRKSRIPFTCAPKISERSPIRLRSLIATCGIISTSAHFFAYTARREASALARAIGESETVIMSTPFSCRAHTPLRNLSLEASNGASSSTTNTFSPRSNLLIKSVGAALLTLSPSAFSSTTSFGWGACPPSTFFNAAICSGVVPQHPPAILIPSGIMRSICFA